MIMNQLRKLKYIIFKLLKNSSLNILYETRFNPAAGNRYYPPLILANHP